ncbi:glycosyltransferase [Tamlana fucoidanivorans]|uniref:Glycosyltransferase n=1 Tax=Allotamlana fucoidanivorans TaxID=2583814 RepID=A0A5C4SP49_9FLAO|nr:glycosyltransferase [Tamlana fucoidanivorans]TNJ45252.1 glycosyltransferase [Tamlana fucoidanivorans]
MIIFCLSITLGYLALMGSLIYGFNRTKPFNPPEVQPKTKFSIVIPFRNEAQNLPQLIASIQGLNYPKELFELILVDDDSCDTSEGIINQLLQDSVLHWKTIANNRQSKSPKKDAITTAISVAKNNWIITTDADCILPKYWLNSFDTYIQNTGVSCVIGPVTYLEQNTLLNRFQILDLLSLQGATMGAFGLKQPFLCNGANFAYKKTLFNAVEGFKNNDRIASGDDVFLLEKMAQNNQKNIGFLKNKAGIVRTNAESSLIGLINQRLRWASKTGAYTSVLGKGTALIVLFMNMLIIITFLLAVLSLFPLEMFCLTVLIKTTIDFILLYKTALFFNQKHVLKSYLWSLCVYPIFCSFIAITSLFSSYTWKERSFKK